MHIGYGVSNEGLRHVCPVAGIGALNTRDNEVELVDSSLSARGGKIFIRDDVGYRAGIHMKEYQAGLDRATGFMPIELMGNIVFNRIWR